MSFLYNGKERLCPIFVPGREMLPCQQWRCLAYEEKEEYYKIEGEMETYKVCFCHALNKELSVQTEEGETENEE